MFVKFFSEEDYKQRVIFIVCIIKVAFYFIDISYFIV